MAYPTKIATCSYCGTRAALVLRGKERHELSCASCGAPLHDMKLIRSDKALAEKPATAHRWDGPPPVRRGAAKPQKAKRRKGFAWRLFEEAVDVIEDLFD